MSVMGHKRTLPATSLASALGPKAVMAFSRRAIRFQPEEDMI
jgi:hypothetical protein